MCHRLLGGAVSATLALLLALPLPAEAASREEVAKSLIVQVEGRLPHASTSGSGILFARRGSHLYIATANHVVRQGIEEADDLRVRFRFWRDEAVHADLLEQRDRTLDLAVLRVDLSSVPVPPETLDGLEWRQLGDALALEEGGDVFPVGNPHGRPWFAPREAAPVHRIVGDEITFEHDCEQGYSGGGLFDETWSLVGMLVTDDPVVCRAKAIHAVFEKLQKAWGLPLSLELGDPVLSEEWTRPEATDRDTISIAVVDFDNRSGYPMRDVGALAHEVVKSFLVDLPKVRVVTRDRLATLTGERVLQDLTSERTVRSRTTERDVESEGEARGEDREDPERSSQSVRTTEVETETRETLLDGPNSRARELARWYGRGLNADYLLTGSFLQYEVQRRELHAYGARATADLYRMSISLLMIDLESGKIRFSDTFDVSHRETYGPRAAPAKAPAKEYELLSRAMEQARQRLEEAIFEKRRQPLRQKRVEVAVATEPPGAEIILNGQYVGSTPWTIEVAEGVQLLKLRLPGHVIWEREVELREGSEVRVTLERGRSR